MGGRDPDPVFPLSFTTIPYPERLSSLSRKPFSFSFSANPASRSSSGQFPYRVKKNWGFSRIPPVFRARIPFQTLYISVYRFLSQSCIRAQILENPSSAEAVKSRILLTFPESCTVFQSNPGAWEYPCRS